MNDSAALSIAVFFENGDIVVKGVLLLLLGGSVWSWAVIMDKIIHLRAARRSARIWATRAADARTAKLLVDERISGEANHPAGAVLAVGVEESMAFDNEPESIAERRECIDRPMRLELGTQLHQPSCGCRFSQHWLCRAVYWFIWHGMGRHAGLQRNRGRAKHKPFGCRCRASPTLFSRPRWGSPRQSPRWWPATNLPSRSAASPG